MENPTGRSGKIEAYWKSSLKSERVGRLCTIDSICCTACVGAATLMYTVDRPAILLEMYVDVNESDFLEARKVERIQLGHFIKRQQ